MSTFQEFIKLRRSLGIADNTLLIHFANIQQKLRGDRIAKTQAEKEHFEAEKEIEQDKAATERERAAAKRDKAALE